MVLSASDPDPQRPAKSLLGENIRRVREAKGYTQLSLAHKMGYSGDDAGAFVSRVESGKQEPRLETIFSFAEALGVDLKELLCVPVIRSISYTTDAVKVEKPL